MNEKQINTETTTNGNNGNSQKSGKIGLPIGFLPVVYALIVIPLVLRKKKLFAE